MKLLTILAAFLLAGAAPPPPAAIVTLAPGQAVNINVAEDSGAVTLDSRGPAALSDFDRGAIRHLTESGNYEAATGPTGVPVTAREAGQPEPAPPAAHLIRIMFAQIADGRQTVLILENGYDRGLVYRARIRANGREQATDVCLVMPARRGYEHWPYPIDRIELSDFRLVPWDASQGIHCE
jgi:hypothetical protein